MTENKSLDILGVKPVSEAINTVVTKSIEGAESFLKTVCTPALEEFGLMYRDKVRNWRLSNVSKMLEKAQGKLEFIDDKLQIKAHPRVALAIIEESSKIDNQTLQDLWAGLFAASCKKDGQDDENLIFINILKLLTSAQAKLLNHICMNAEKVIYENGLIVGHDFIMNSTTIQDIMEISEIHRIDRELDHLRSLELIREGFSVGNKEEELKADVSPSTLTLNLYVRCQGFSGTIEDYWKENLINANRIHSLTRKILPLPDQSNL